MAGKVLAVLKLEEIKRLKKLGLSDRAIARALRCSRNTVKDYLEKANHATEAPQAQPRLAMEVGEETAATAHPDKKCHWAKQIDWQQVNEDARQGTPLLVLWEEHREAGKLSVQYAGFWKQFQKRFPQLPQSMHRIFAPGSRAEIDYCDGIDLLNPITGEIHKTQLFVGVLCHSRYVFAEFTLSQRSEDFLASHVRMFTWFGGVTQVLSPDNLRSAVTKAHRYDPVINPAYSRLAEHYGVAVVPARVRTPKDKAIVERTIQIFQRWFYFRVRHQTFTSLVEMNQSLREHLHIFHSKKHRIFNKTRMEMFEIEKSALGTLPPSPYAVMTHYRATPHSDCHLIFEKNYYSAPFLLRGKELDIWATDTTVEVFNAGTRVAFHVRSKSKGGDYVTSNDHYPPAHQAYAEATPAFLRNQADQVGPHTAQLIGGLICDPHPLRYLRRAHGILRLSKTYGPAQLERAAEKANRFEQKTYVFIERILKNGQAGEVKPAPAVQRGSNPFLRGEELFH